MSKDEESWAKYLLAKKPHYSTTAASIGFQLNDARGWPVVTKYGKLLKSHNAVMANTGMSFCKWKKFFFLNSTNLQGFFFYLTGTFAYQVLNNEHNQRPGSERMALSKVSSDNTTVLQWGGWSRPFSFAFKDSVFFSQPENPERKRNQRMPAQPTFGLVSLTRPPFVFLLSSSSFFLWRCCCVDVTCEYPRT